MCVRILDTAKVADTVEKLLFKLEKLGSTSTALNLL